MWYPTKQGKVVSITNQLILKQPWKVSNVQHEQQWTENTTLWHTRYDINTRTTHTIYLNSLSTTGQKIPEHLQDQATNSSFQLTSTDDVQKSITGTQTLYVWILVRWQDPRFLQKATKTQSDQPFKNLRQNWCNRNRSTFGNWSHICNPPL